MCEKDFGIKLQKKNKLVIRKWQLGQEPKEINTFTTSHNKKHKQLFSIHKAGFFYLCVCFKERFLGKWFGFFEGQRKTDHRTKQFGNCLSEPKVKKERSKNTQIPKHWLISLALLKKLYRCDFSPGLPVYI